MQWLEEANSKITQGTIVYGVDWDMGKYNPLSIVITNSCDLEHDKCGFINVLALEPAVDIIAGTKEFLSYTKDAKDFTISSKAWKSLSHYLDDIIYNKNIIRYYFFDTDPIIDAGLLVADFQRIQSIPFEKNNKLEIIAKLKSPFIEQLMIHYISYTGRIPSDRVDDTSRNKYIDLLSGNYHKKDSLL
jgi:hypothetical protein